MIKKVRKSWGSEIWLINNELYCAKILNCHKNKWSSNGLYHYHKKKDETFYILHGKIILDVEGKETFLGIGDSYRIFPGQRHRFKSLSPISKILEVSTHHDDTDSFRVKSLEEF